MRKVASLVIVLAVVGCNKDRPDATPPEVGGAAASETDAQRLTFAEAIAKASALYPDAPAIEVEVEKKDGKELLEVEFLVGDGIKEVYLDPFTGEVVLEADEELSAEEAAALPDLRAQIESSGVKLTDVVSLSEASYDVATIKEIELTLHEGALGFVVEAGDGAFVHDAASGEKLGDASEESEPAEADG